MGRRKTFDGSRKKTYICDMPARMLQKHRDLTKAARHLWATMRSLANGKTGELEIKGSPLSWQHICRRAEIGRYTWLKAIKELIGKGYVSCVRERVPHYKGFRKRMVLGKAHYFAHREQKTVKTPLFLLKSDSPTVGGSDPQVFQTHPTATAVEGRGVAEIDREQRNPKSSSPPADDDSRLTPVDSKTEGKPNLFLTGEDEALVRDVQARLEAQYPDTFMRHREKIEDSLFVLEAIELIGQRGDSAISVPVAYFARGLVGILDSDVDMLAIADILTRKKYLRDKWMPKVESSLTPAQEEARRQFKAMREGQGKPS